MSSAPSSRSDWSGFGALFEVDLRSVAALRIGLGTLTLADLWIRSYDLVLHYTDQGWFPVALARAHPFRRWAFSLHELSGSAEWIVLLFLLQALFALAMVVGHRSRLATFLVWVLTLSLHARTPGVNDGADMLIRLLLLWCMLLPCGARLSLDALRDPDLRRLPDTVRGGAAFALAIQPFLLYQFAGIAKWVPEWVEEGAGVYYAFSFDQLAKPLGKYLLGFPTLLVATNYFTLGLEALGPFGLYSPWRRDRVRLATIATFLGLQVGFGQCIRLMHFPWLSTFSVLGLIPSSVWDRLGVPGQQRDGWPATRPAVSRPVNLLAAGLMYLSFLGMLPTVPRPLFDFQPWFYRVHGLLRIDQHWRLFSPPPIGDGWVVIEGVTLDGRRFDLRWDRPLTFDKPPGPWQFFDSHRSWAFHRFVVSRPGRYARSRYLQVHRQRSPHEKQLQALRLYYVLEVTPKMDEEPDPARPILLWEQKRYGGVRTVRPGEAAPPVVPDPGPPIQDVEGLGAAIGGG